MFEMGGTMSITESYMDSAQRLRELSEFSRLPAASYLEQARAALREILADPHLLDRIVLKRDCRQYTRTLLFGGDQMSAWAILWPPGSQTSIHDHHCSCCFGVVRGSLKEIWFRAVGDQQVVVHAVADREPGYVAAMLPEGPNIHQMINNGGRHALSVHIYGFDHTIQASSIRQEYHVVQQ